PSKPNCKHFEMHSTTVFRLTPFLSATAWSLRPSSESSRIEARKTLRLSSLRERRKRIKRCRSSGVKHKAFRCFANGIEPSFYRRTMPEVSSIVYLLKELSSRHSKFRFSHSICPQML